jgi:hypothetical protein
MSNLLERLVTRSVHAQTQIRPRLRGPYEALSFGILAAPGVTAPNPIEPEASSDDPPSMTEPTMFAAAAPEGRRTRADQRAGAREPLVTPRREDISSGPRIERTTVEREVEAAPASPDRLHSRRTAPATLRAARVQSVEVDDRVARRTQNAADDAGTFRPAREQPSNEVPAIRPSSAIEPALPPLAPTRAHDTPRSRTSRAAGEQDAPVIHVRIGRIDVRAVVETPPTRPQPRRSGRPPLELEEYLRQRNRGER